MRASYSKLRDGSWGFRIDSTVSIGEKIECETKAGKVAQIEVTSIAWSGTDAKTGAPVTIGRFVDCNVANQHAAQAPAPAAPKGRGKGNGRQQNGPPPATGPIVIDMLDGSKVGGLPVLIMSIPYVSECENIRNAIKGIDGWKYDGATKLWSVPVASEDRMRTIIGALLPAATICDKTQQAAPAAPVSQTQTKEPPEVWGRRVLGLAASVPLTTDAVKAAYKIAVKAAHPDKGGSTEKFVEVQAAKTMLIGSARRSPRDVRLRRPCCRVRALCAPRRRRGIGEVLAVRRLHAHCYGLARSPGPLQAPGLSRCRAPGLARTGPISGP
jgi:hypothetical protein